MKQDRLLILANVIALFTIFWIWLDHGTAQRSSENAKIGLQKVTSIGAEISQLRTDLADRVYIAEQGYDPLDSVWEAVKKTGLGNKRFTSSETSARKVGATDVNRCLIKIPAYQLPLSKIVKLVINLSDVEANFQVAKITLKRPERNSSTEFTNVEQWDVTFDELVYLKSAIGGK